MVRAQHTCPEESAMAVQALCEDGSIGTSDIFILIAVLVLLVGLGIVLWNWSRKRFQE